MLSFRKINIVKLHRGLEKREMTGVRKAGVQQVGLLHPLKDDLGSRVTERSG